MVYYNERVKRDVFAFPAGILANYFRRLDLMPHSHTLGNGLFELRPNGREGIGRVFYCTHVGRQVVVLHSFVKKTQETPPQELRIAQARLREVRNG
ncbi:type II toxin-antitoxin system RelE/ParE family toxin [Burkholderia ubonensis]|uniref:type II toxin-antitoxin system RelE/ParE family toxin n=1 Tax=Burkholderia ubonensis TaxID=101571 RepID=UPI0007586FEB|nr:type II toxin-antitoxin system RelE/ParE family toxin [Burkholderia ubonensis]